VSITLLPVSEAAVVFQTQLSNKLFHISSRTAASSATATRCCALIMHLHQQLQSRTKKWIRATVYWLQVSLRAHGHHSSNRFKTEKTAKTSQIGDTQRRASCWHVAHAERLGGSATPEWHRDTLPLHHDQIHLHRHHCQQHCLRQLQQ